MPLDKIGGAIAAAGAGGPASSPLRKDTGFAATLSQALARADAPARSAEESVKSLVAGRAESPHDVMIRMEEAHLALLWTVQVRNRVMDAYNEIMRMPL
jgi:flagellar hook-basal body complex protein FliE